MSQVDEILKNRRIVIACGTGGVGKTTVSAAIAIRAALQGKRTIVVTIDPAKRLATSLGLDVGSKKNDNQPTDLTNALRAACEKVSPENTSFQGRLLAVIPDTRNTFENFVKSLTTSEAVANRVINNPIFQVFAKEFSGTNEYMALQTLYTLAKNPEYDCIILDTPPSRSTLAFLEAPKLLSRLFEEKFIRWLAVPANKIMAVGMKMAMGALERLTGSGFMTHLLEFSSALFEVQASFTANLKSVMDLLKSDRVAAILVTVPSSCSRPELGHFIAELEKHGLAFEGIAVNRTLGGLEADGTGLGELEAVSLVQALQRVEAGILDEIRKDGIPLCARLPELARDVHTMEDLLHVALALAPHSVV